MAVGNAGGGYANLEASPNYIGDAIRYNIDNGFKIRAEKRLDDQNKADAEEKRIDREDKLAKEYSKEDEGWNLTQSTIAGVDAKAIERVYKNQEEVNRLRALLRNPSLSLIERTNYNTLIKRKFTETEQMSQINKQAKERMAELVKGMQDGSLDMESAKEALEKLKSLNSGDYHFDANNEGLGTIDNHETDKDGKKVLDEKGNPKIKSSQTYAEFLSGVNADKASTYAKDEQASVKTYMPDKSVIGEGGRITSKAVVDTEKGSRDWKRIGAFVDTYLDKENERKILGRKLGIDPNNIEELRDKLILNYMAGTKNETSDLPDTAQQSLYETKRQHNFDNAQKIKETPKPVNIKTLTIGSGAYWLDKSTGNKFIGLKHDGSVEGKEKAKKELAEMQKSGQLIHMPPGSKIAQYAPTKYQLDMLSGKGSASGLTNVWKQSNGKIYGVIETKAVNEDRDQVAGSVPSIEVIEMGENRKDFERHFALQGYNSVEDALKSKGITASKKTPTTTKKVEGTKKTEKPMTMAEKMRLNKK
jgi:hypothetical protein